MKNVAVSLILGVLAFIPNLSHAQLNSLSLEISDTVFPDSVQVLDMTVVRNKTNRHAVGFIKTTQSQLLYSYPIDSFFTSNGSEFYFFDTLHLPKGMEIHDMQFVYPRLFFCGTYGHDTAFYGWIDTAMISDNFANTYTLYIRRLDDLVSLEKMAFINPVPLVNNHLFAIGKREESSVVHDCIVYVPRPAFTEYYYKPLPATDNYYKETLQDVLYSEGQVFYVGMDTRSATTAITVRVFEEEVEVSNPYTYSIYRYTPSNPAIRLLPFQYTRTAVLPGRRLAVAHQRFFSAEDRSPALALSIIECGNDMANSMTQIVHNNQLVDLCEMRYVGGSLPLLCSRSASSDIYLFDPNMTSPYAAQRIGLDDWRYTSFDTLGSVGIIASGAERWFMQRISISSLMQGCHLRSGVSVSFDDPYTRIVYKREFSDILHTAYMGWPNDTVLRAVLDKRCIK